MKEFNLPARIFPCVGLDMGYPAEDPLPSTVPFGLCSFRRRVSPLDSGRIERAMKTMDEGYLAQDYYRKINYKIPLKDRKENFTFDDYSWTEHICRKLRQWYRSLEEQMIQLEKCGFRI